MSTQQPNLIKAYTRATHTVAKTRQVVMLYDGIIRFLKQAAEAMEKGQIEERYIKLTRATDVISGMQSCLDFESGGDTAQVLYDFYSSLEGRIFALHRSPNASQCLAIVGELKAMRDVWDTIDRAKDGEPAVTTPAAPVEQAAEAVMPAPTSVKFSA